MGWAKITDAGLKEVSKLQQLKALGLKRTKVTDAGLKEVAKLKKLKLLDARDTKITDAGMAGLQKALPKCDINGPVKLLLRIGVLRDGPH